MLSRKEGQRFDLMKAWM